MKRPEPRLENWSTTNVREDASPYQAPEQRGTFVQGKLYGDALFPEGGEVVTSAVRKVKGHLITTENGTRYRLGVPDPAWLAWLSKNRIPFDPDHPIRVVRR